MRRYFILIAASLPLAAGQPAPAADPADAATRQKLAGVWVGRVDNGATGHTLTFTTDSIAGTKDGTRDLGQGSYRLDLTSLPWHMDATEIKADGTPGATWLGTFRLEGDALTWCVSKAARPTQFDTGNGQFMLVLQRQPPSQAGLPAAP